MGLDVFVENLKRRTVMTAQTVGYIRISTEGQDLEKNKNDIYKLVNDKKLGNVDFVEEKVSRKVGCWMDRYREKLHQWYFQWLLKLKELKRD